MGKLWMLVFGGTGGACCWYWALGGGVWLGW